MKRYDFDEHVNREGSNCIKYDSRVKYFGRNDVLPLWVADMDFKTPDFIINAMRERLNHELLGYTFRPDSFNEAIISWLKQRHAWDINEKWISFSPGVVAGFTLAIETFSKPGDEVIIQPPVYSPFFDSVRLTGRKLIENPLVQIGGRYTFDIEDLREKITGKTRLLLLCNPHNPGGMVWTTEELSVLAEICSENNIMIISDEIHADIIYPGYKHTPVAMLSDAIAQNCVVLMAASKTFNIAGLTTSYLIIPNRLHHVRYERTLTTPHLHLGNIFGNIALEAAYNHGAPWLEQMIDYLNENYNLLESYLKKYLPQVVPMRPEATYLTWLDFSRLGLSDDEVNARLIEAGVGLNRGLQFGKQGSGFMRINMACPRSVLQEALKRVAGAFGG